MSSALNVFTTVASNVTTATTTIYTSPSNYTTVVLMGQMTNNSSNVVTVSATYIPVSTGIPFSLINNAQVPVNDSLNFLSGKLVLMTGDSITVSSSANNSVQVILSLLQTLNQ